MAWCVALLGCCQDQAQIYGKTFSVFDLLLTSWQILLSLYFLSLCLYDCWDWVCCSQFFFLRVLPFSYFSGQPYFLLSSPEPNLPPPCPPPPPHHHLHIALSTHLLLLFTLMANLLFAKPPSFLFLPPLPLCQILLMCYVCLLARPAHTYTHLCSGSLLLSHSIMWPSSSQSEMRLLDEPNICLCCLCCLSQSEWLLMLVPVSTCCCFVCFLCCLRERKCAFPARGGSWINSALSAFIPKAQLITAAEGYTVARLAALLTHSLKAAVVYIGRLQWRASRGDCFLFLFGGGRREKER